MAGLPANRRWAAEVRDADTGITNSCCGHLSLESGFLHVDVRRRKLVRLGSQTTGISRGTEYSTDGVRSFSIGWLPRGSRWNRKSGGGRDPGDFWRQSPHSRGVRSSRKRRLRRGRARHLRSNRAEFSIGLLAGRDHGRSQIYRQSRLGGDAARHASRD